MTNVLRALVTSQADIKYRAALRPRWLPRRKRRCRCRCRQSQVQSSAPAIDGVVKNKRAVGSIGIRWGVMISVRDWPSKNYNFCLMVRLCADWYAMRGGGGEKGNWRRELTPDVCLSVSRMFAFSMPVYVFVCIASPI